jgi:predicted 2-oxoglutarate/Fe(II)-dependent dioxygenase YbiX
MYHLYVGDFLTDLECDELIERGLNTEMRQMSSSKIINGILVKHEINEYTNKRKGSYITNDLLSEKLYELLTDKLLSSINEKKIFNSIEYKTISKYTFNEYGEGDFLDWHKDSHEIMYGATLTIIIQLNDNYEGGDVQYTINDLTHNVPKKKGSIFLFDSNLNHSVSKIKNGIRYSMNAWPSSYIKKSLI